MDYQCSAGQVHWDKNPLKYSSSSNYNPRKANKTAGLSAALSHYSHWGDARYQNSEHAERLAARGETRRIIRREKPCLTATGYGTVMSCMWTSFLLLPTCNPTKTAVRWIHHFLCLLCLLLSSPGPKPLAQKPKNPKPRGLGLTLKSHGPPPHQPTPPPHPITFKHEGGVPQ